MPEGFEVVATELDGHSSAVEGYAEDVAEAVEAGMESIQPETYGVFCLSIAMTIGGLEMFGVSIVDQCAETLRGMAKTLKVTAQQYTDLEQSTRSTFSDGVR